MNLYQVVVGQQSVRTLFKSLANTCKCFFKKWPKITLYRISYHFRSIPQFLFFGEIFVQNGCRRPFWMSENHFRSHFWSFQIDTQLYFFLEICDKMAAISHFGCPKFTFDRISGHFRSIVHFGFTKFTFDSNSGHFSSIQNFFFQRLNHCPKIISGHF